ncbi:MAG: glycosyltransferase family 4 protein [Candidatus Omnitrophica bacterium]|nr:glycosyltransferase family 4 protein [Candidatus Omnitrophota bacterium]
MVLVEKTIMTRGLKDIKLALFFSAGVGLDVWAANGMLDRELALYKALSACLAEVDFITYGGVGDLKYADHVKEINLFANPWIRRPHKLEKYLLTLNSAIVQARQHKLFKNVDVLKTNQISGSEVAVSVKKKFGKKLIVRCGYVPSRLMNIASGHSISMANLGNPRSIYVAEKSAFANADVVIVPTENDKKWVMEVYKTENCKIRVLPNYVETERFKEQPYVEKKYDIVIVARNSHEKNIPSIIDALKYLKSEGIDLSVIFVGSSGMSDVVQKNKELFNITTAGNVESKDMPFIYSSSKIFLIASFYEGNSKVLLEAMSCGLPCIGTDVDSINTIITHRKTGYLCRTDGVAIANAIKDVIRDEHLQKAMGQNARRLAIDRFSIEGIIKAELDIIGEVAQK